MADGYSVVSFAYNEAETIADAIRSIINNSDHRLEKITIVANGCTDETVIVASTILKSCTVPYFILDLKLGDKCNAWNNYIHKNLPKSAVHFFVDSDVTFTNNAFPLLFDQLVRAHGKNAITGLPQAGRNIQRHTELATKYSCLFGNLYGLTDEFVQRLVTQKICLPVGLSWIDSQITKLVNENLEYKKDDYQHRVTFLEGVGYQFESLHPWRLADIKLYINKICRYKVGQLQEPYLDAMPFVDWPNTMNDINLKILNNGVSLGSLGEVAPFRHKVMKRLRKKFKVEPGAHE